MKTKRLTVAQAIVLYLANQYTEYDGQEERLIAGMWGIQGHGNVPGLGQAMQEYGLKNNMPFYRPQNEQAQVHAAVAYARHKNRTSTFACTASIGPGSSNMVTGAALATINRIPVLLLPSDYFANRIPDPVLQQLEHMLEHDVSVNDVFRPVSKFFTRISRPEQLLSALPQAMRVLTDPVDTGAVTISLPEDLQTEVYDWPVEMFSKGLWHIRRPLAEPELIDKLVALLKKSKRPMIIAGGGVKYSLASQELSDFAAKYNIPVCDTQAGKGVLNWQHAMSLGNVGSLSGSAASQVANTADLVIAIGTRLADFTTASKTAFNQTQIASINVAAYDANKMLSLPIVADAKRAILALDVALENANYKGTSKRYQRELQTWKKEWDEIIDSIKIVKEADKLSQAEVIAMTNDIYGGDAVVINAAGSIPGEIPKIWRTTSSDSYHVEYGYSCMGYEIPAGIGVHMAEPEREVVVFIGDGSYLMMNSEIVTAVVENMNLTIVIVDNHGFQSIHGLQQATGTPHFALELRHRNKKGLLDGKYMQVDYAKHAEAMGATAVFVKTEAEYRKALAVAKKSYGVNVIAVEVDPNKKLGSYS
ncbi:MAG TPA: 3D-(3,5/4)-trihydroxycyclohexane-1,2-dione acylhydrolase (decyclizing), partial [Trueperaceae bacterium]|nr:3D-(3,5/4)-trihydroxycyclohexane-1,2-dione acylhydrolase (decyclizing) [Trueperaceae bacterium]